MADIDDVRSSATAEKLDSTERASRPDVEAMDRDTFDTPQVGGDVAERKENETPVGLKSSPPLLRTDANAAGRKLSVDDASDAVRSDSEAETVVLPGPDGYSPSKLRRKREIKLEDKPSDDGMGSTVVASVKNESAGEDHEKHGERRDTNNSSLLGKRKRSKHTISGLDDAYAGNSSGLSSIPTSPVAPGRSNLSREFEIDQRSFTSAYSQSRGSDDDAVTTNAEYPNGRNTNQREHRRRISRDSSGSDHYSRLSIKDHGDTRRRHALSHSPNRGGTTINSRSASSGAIHEVPRKKRAVPQPLRATRENHPAEYSDESSAFESSHSRRRSKTFNQATTPTGDLTHKMARKRANKYGRTPLADAAEAGHYEKAKAILAEYPEDLDFPDAAGNTPLQCASLNGHDDIVELLIKSGCNIHCNNQDGDSPLLDAVENGHLGIVKQLLDAGVDPRARNAVGDEPAQKINYGESNASEIKKALEEAKSKYSAVNRPIAASQIPQHESSELHGRRTTGHGRANRTGQRHLYQHYNRTSLRDAAAKGDLETVGNIIQVLVNEEGLDDAQATLNAARGGHHDVVDLLLGLGNANPDPEPLENVEWGYATPMLAAIGGNNTEVIKLLLQQARDGRLNPTRTYFGKTYSDIARERGGPCWPDEVRLLDDAYNEYKGPRASSILKVDKKQTKHSGQRRGSASRGESKPTGPDLSSPVRRSTARARKELPGISEGDVSANLHQKDKHFKSTASDRASSPTESEPAKSRRRLLSGREMKAEKERSKSYPDSSLSLPSVSKAAESIDEDSKVASSQQPDFKTSHKSPIEPMKPSLKENASIRGSSPSKRPRKASMSQSDSQDPASKRRRVESGAKEQAVGDRGRTKLDDNPKAPRSERPTNRDHTKGQNQDARRTSAFYGGSRAASIDQHSSSRSASKPEIETSKPRSPEQHFNSLDDYVLNKSKKNAERKAAQEKIEAERKAIQDMKDEKVKAERLEKERAEYSKLEETERLVTIAAKKADAEKALEESKLLEEQDRALAVQKAKEDERRRQEAEAIRLKELKVAEEARLREDGEQKRAEADRLIREEEQMKAEAARQEEELERKKNEAIAENARQEQARIAARLDSLPPLVRFVETYPELRLPFLSEAFSLLRGVRGDTIDPTLAGTPAAREQWVLNAQAALLLGEKDALDPKNRKFKIPFDCFQALTFIVSLAGWQYIPASRLAKESLWRFEHHIYSMTHHPLSNYNPGIKPCSHGDGRRVLPQAKVNEITNLAKQQFLNTDLYFIRLSDFMAAVPKLRHLKDVKLTVLYIEALPDESWLNKCQLPPAKWRTDSNSEIDKPSTKVYVNGALETAKIETPSALASNVSSRRVSQDLAENRATATPYSVPGEEVLDGNANGRGPNGDSSNRAPNGGRVPLPTGPGVANGPNGTDKGKGKDVDRNVDVTMAGDR